MFEDIYNLIKATPNDKIFIIAHADHDGICASVGLNYVFGEIKTEFSRFFRPKFIELPSGTELLIINDLLVSEKQLGRLLERGIKIINLDHHDIRDSEDNNYYCLNPKKLWKKEFISSSGLVWKLFRPEKIAWMLAAGSAGDAAIEDSMELFELVQKQHPGLINDLSLEGIYNSKIFEIAETIWMSFPTPQKGFALLKGCIDSGFDYSLIFRSEFHSRMKEKQVTVEKELAGIEKVEEEEFILLDTSGRKFSGYYSIFSQVRHKDKRIHMEYANGGLYLRNYLGRESILGIARLFGGGGAHSRSGGAYTKKSFREVTRMIKHYFTASELE